MEADLQSFVTFYLTGRRQATPLEGIEALKLCPASFSGFQDLTRLRYDFPLVLVDEPVGEGFAEALSGVIDALLQTFAADADGERIRKLVLRLEQTIRQRLAHGASGRLSELWDQAAQSLIAQDAQLADSLGRARERLILDGELLDCNGALPNKLIGHAWLITQQRRARRFNDEVERLILKLTEIIEADYAASEASRSAESLRHAFGAGPLNSFDFEAMSTLLKRVSVRENLSERRLARIRTLINTLRSQKFYPADSALNAPYCFAFHGCCAAFEAYCERQAEAIELARAIFPDYLVRMNAAALTGAEQSTLTDILSADLPIKILVQTDDILEKSPLENGHLAFTLRSKQLARMTMGMGVYVVQSPAASLYRMRQAIQGGLEHAGSAVFSIYSGDSPATAALPPYLVSAAASESRLFPVFCSNPGAGRDWASRFSLAGNPQAENDWPLHELVWQDENYQSVRESVPFSLIDFVALDARYAKHFARVPTAHWSQYLVPVAVTLEKVRHGAVTQVPYLIMSDAAQGIHRVLVDEKLIREARRCCTAWNTLRELGGVCNSHAAKLLATEKANWQKRDPEVSTVAASVPGVAVAEGDAESASGEAYIETPRCASCNACLQINNKLFAYDGNQQAFIADLKAGTYAQLVEAAENCQVAIIHPGKPQNPHEAGLAELVRRAEAFL